MSKQIYIDSNGNEIQVSGTVNTADMMPMSGNDSTKVSEAIGSLSTLTTTDKSSIVGAVNEVDGNKAELKYVELSGTTNPNGLLSFDRNKKIVSAICTTANYVLFQIQDYVIVKHYNTFAIIVGEAVKFDVYYYEP